MGQRRGSRLTALTACPQNGRNQQFTFMRPTGLPGREIDAQFGLQVQQLRLQQAQANEAAGVPQVPQIQRQLHCIANVIGNQIFTNCF